MSRKDNQADYVAEASKYHDTWVSSEVTGNEPTQADTIQSALVHGNEPVDGNWGKHLR